ncbi:MAG: hypothetical protein RIA08_18295 [Roseovarius sp.]|uniref:hypothetical protein n=1 Tax=Roseovarius sp. TaxID=1486281 RepID=UPI0032EDED9C
MAEAKTKTPLTEEQKQRRWAGRKLAFLQFNQQYRATNPEASKEERNAAWKEAKKVQTKIALRTLTQMEKAGFGITAPAPKAQAAE